MRTGPESARLRRGRFVAMPFTTVEPGDAEDGPVRGTRRVACPFCQAPARLPTAALSHCCAECGRHYLLQDRDIYGEVHANLATAGTIVVHHRARLVSAWARCGGLVVHGQAAGALTVTGRAEYHGQGKALGELHCGHLVITRGAHRSFHQRVFAMAADIHGEITGDVCCAGRLQVSRGGAVNGAVLAGQVAIDAGGRINGSMATLQPVLGPAARLTDTARDLLQHFDQNDGIG
jgi:cytoskeletal protein CcmA (bactofilin family)